MTTDAAPDFYQQIIASFSSGVVALDRNGVIVTSNPAASKHLAVAEENLRPGSRLDTLPGVEPFVDVVRQVMTSRTPVSRHEIVLPQPDGAHKVIGLSASLLQGPESFNGAIFLFIDMTELRHLERVAQLNQQLARIGEMTAGVVHELRNPVSAISGMVELLMRSLGPDDERRATAELIAKETAQLEKTIAQFLGFARPFELTLTRCRPEDIVSRASRLCARPAARKHVTLDAATDPNAPGIVADLEKASQALANVVDNAIDAVSKGGRVELRAYRDGEHVVFEVLDDGPGIRVGPADDIFKPFFTMKESGTGLGLSIVKRIVSAHGGTVSYANREQGGARFEIRLRIDI